MKKITKICMILLTVFALICSQFSDAYVYEVWGANIPENEIITEETNELLACSIISQYFLQREALLCGNSEAISSAVPAISSDESSHRSSLAGLGISYVESEIVITSVQCWDDTITAQVTEFAVFCFEDQCVQETIFHSLIMYMTGSETMIVASDAYHESFSDFYSCSFVHLPDNSASTAAAPTGSKLCIVEVAEGEIGYTEGDYDTTKYGTWYGGNAAWCAMFVSWCANQANVSTSVIKKTASSGDLRSFFLAKGAYYLSSGQGGNTTPMVGDIFFEGESASAPNHVGIVVGVDSNNIYVIDGNCENKVSSHAISRTAGNLVAFGRPAYATTGHSGGAVWSTSSTHHWKNCTNCDAVTNKTKHTFVLVQTGGPYRCSVCSYTTYSIPATSTPDMETAY